MNRSDKSQLVDELNQHLTDAYSVVLADHSLLDVNTVNELRSELRANGVHYQVIKNTLARLAVQGTGFEGIVDQLRGPTAWAFSKNDAVAPAKLLKKFAKDHDKFVIRGGFLDGASLDVTGVEQLAEMPTKDELQSKLLGLFQAVPAKFLRQLNAAPTQFLLVLKAKQDKDAA